MSAVAVPEKHEAPGHDSVGRLVSLQAFFAIIPAPISEM